MSKPDSTNLCRRYGELIEDYLAGTLSAVDASDLQDHCAECPDCAAALRVDRELTALGDDVPLPDRDALRRMREHVLDETAPYEQRTAPSGGFLAELARLWRIHPLPSGLATSAILVGVAFLGRTSAPRASLEDELLRQSAGWEQARAAGLDDYWDVPVTFTNVMVRTRDEGRLALSFDASNHLDMVVAEDSPLARAVLTQAILEPSSMGSRLKAMEVTPRLNDDRLQAALIMTVLGDPDVTVRVNALAVLTEYADDELNREALLQVLGRDPDVQMRLLALEELKRRNVGAETLRDAAGANEFEGTPAVLRQVAAEL
ncbi:MAG: zf-HC2 domain-containing protein [bacterium]|nr:zf-HC2 domain-containing protein [bacterium]